MDSHGAIDLTSRARTEMVNNGFQPDFEPDVLAQAQALPQGENLTNAAAEQGEMAEPKDLRNLLWSSIDNVESQDLDQIEYAEALPDGSARILVGIADVAAYVPKDSPIDKHAAFNTTSVYTGVVNFPMLPDQLSYHLTSLLPDVDRRAMIIELVIDKEGEVVKSDCYPAIVRNRAKLDYASVGGWLQNVEDAAAKGETLDATAVPAKIAALKGLTEQLLLQNDLKERIHQLRNEHGSLTLHTPEATTVAKDGQVLDLELVEPNPARELIENFMIVANVATSHFLESKNQPSIRRTVKSPSRWPRIVDVAAQYGDKLPAEPNALALAQFLLDRRKADPLRFPDLSLTIVKLLGRGQYVVEVPGQKDEGHFALAVNDYTHATAPNRRFSDLVTQRLLQAVMAGQPSPYTLDELNKVAADSTDKEAAEKKVERTMRKVAAAVLFSKKIGQTFDGIVTGVKGDAVFVRLTKPPVEGRIVGGDQNNLDPSTLDIGDQVQVKLTAVNPENSHIDFALVANKGN